MRIEEIRRNKGKAYKFTVNITGLGKKVFYTATREEGEQLATILLRGIA